MVTVKSFEKAFFPTEEETNKQEEFINKLLEEEVTKRINKGMSRTDAERQLENDVKEFIGRGYYS